MFPVGTRVGPSFEEKKRATEVALFLGLFSMPEGRPCKRLF
jgi:hypothetical protein